MQTVVVVAGLTVLALTGTWGVLRTTRAPDRWWGEVQPHLVDLARGSHVVPTAREAVGREGSAWTRELWQEWAGRPLETWENRGRGRGQMPRILLARLASGAGVAEANAFLQAARPWGRPGSSWGLHREGDYDFALVPLTALLWLHGDRPETLWPETREHLVHTLLTESGGEYRAKVPRSLGLVSETENHLLMTEGSRYLKNRWLALHGRDEACFDNVANGLEAKVRELLARLRREGLYEFNSQPYIAYTLAALLNLEAFAAEPVREEARALLDELNYAYALGAHRLRHFAPFRRRVDRAGETSLTAGYQTAFFAAWASLGTAAGMQPPKLAGAAAGHALTASILPYRPPDAVLRLATAGGGEYLARLGHGPEGSPEIFARHGAQMLSAGGVARGRRALLVARPIVLWQDDTATELAEVFHLAGPGEDFGEWNNTGVHRELAVAAGPVRVPAGARVVEEAGGWRRYAGQGERDIAVYAGEGYGLLVLTAEPLARIVAANSESGALARRFRFPDGREVGYDPGAERDTWVIERVDGAATDRAFDGWPRWDVAEIKR